MTKEQILKLFEENAVDYVGQPSEAEKKIDNDKFGIWWEIDKGENYIVHDKSKWTYTVWPKSMVKAALKKSSGTLADFEIEDCFLFIHRERRIDQVFSALSGYNIGIQSAGAGRRMLIRTSPELPVPKKGEWPTIKELLERKLNLALDTDDASVGPNQEPYFHAWMKVALESLRAGPGNFQSGQVLILAGPADCYKSRIQENVITPMLGGRSANPGPFLFQRTDFNGELFRAEHLQIHDPATKTLFHDRTLLRAA